MNAKSKIAICSFALVLTACEDPSVAQRAQAQRRLDDASEAIAQSARQASIDRVGAAESLRAAAGRAQGIAGASAGQQQAAAALVASARTQAALLELGRLNQLESSARAQRALALSLARAALWMQDYIDAHDKAAVTEASSALALTETDAKSVMRERTTFHDELAQKVQDLEQAHTDALQQAQALMQEAEATRQRGLSAGRGEITLIAEEAGRQRDDARTFQTRAAEAEADKATEGSRLRLAAGDAESARRRAETIAKAIEALELLAGQYDETGVTGGEVIANLRERIAESLEASNPEQSEQWTQGVERLTGDLEAADGAASQANGTPMLRHQLDIAKARTLLARSDAALQHALVTHALAGNAAFASTASTLEEQATASLTKAQEFARQAIEAYTAAKDGISGSGDPTPESAALAVTIERAIATIGTPSLDAPTTPKPRTARAPAAQSAPAAEAEPAAEVASSNTPPFATVEGLVAFLNGAGGDPTALVRAAEVYQASSPEGQAFVDAISGLTVAVAEVQLAAKEKFGSTSLGPMGDQMTTAGRGTAKIVESSESSATIEMGGPAGSINLVAAKSDSGWKIDGDATLAGMPEAQRAQMVVGLSMMSPMVDAFRSIAKQVRDGEIADAAGIGTAIMRAMQESMTGGGGVSP